MLSDEQWALIQHLFPMREARQGRPPLNRRQVVEGILWVLSKGERWQNLPRQYPSAQTCYNLWLQWRRSGVWEQIVATLGTDEGAATLPPIPPQCSER